jgi:hypothetical protein
MFRMGLLAGLFTAAVSFAAAAATVQYQAKMDGKQEVPAKDSGGYGDFLGSLDTKSKELTYTVTYGGLSGPATAAHIHGPADPGANAGVLAPLGGKDPGSPIHGTATLTDDQIKQLNAGKLYVNVHTAANPGGEIRGQLMPGGARAAMMQPGMGQHTHPMKPATGGKTM